MKYYLLSKKIILILFYLYYIIEYKNPEIIKINPLFINNKRNLTSLLQKQAKQFIISKLILLKFMSESIGKNITNIRQIYIKNNFNFGNQMVLISNVIYYCEILQCKRIILDKNSFWFIRKTIINKKYKMKIEVKAYNKKNCFVTLIDNTSNFFYFYSIFKAKSRVELLRNEIYKNLPKVVIDFNDLYIYIRSGDIFTQKNSNHKYIQPPLCFYLKVINDYKFKQIYLISENKNNPIINKLLKIFPNIIYKKNSLKIDIAKLVNAFNIAGGGISTFFYNILSLNVNLHILWLFKFNYIPFNLIIDMEIINIKNNITYFVMYSTKDYVKKMYPWRNSKIQRDYMLNYNCTNYFFINK